MCVSSFKIHDSNSMTQRCKYSLSHFFAAILPISAYMVSAAVGCSLFHLSRGGGESPPDGQKGGMAGASGSAEISSPSCGVSFSNTWYNGS